MRQMNSVSLEDARRIIAAAEANAVRTKSPSKVAVVDAGGNLLSFVRMDGTWLGSIDKAFTSRAFDIATEDPAEPSQLGGQLYGLAGSDGGRVMTLAGGVALKVGGKAVVTVGVSGGSSAQDQQIAEAGTAAL